VPIESDAQLAQAVATAGQLLQEIFDYTQRTQREDAKVRFPRGLIKTAGEYRALLPSYVEPQRASSCAYAFMHLDVLWWLGNRTDITLTAKEMVLKSGIITLATITEAVLTIHRHAGFGPGQEFKQRINTAVQLGLMEEEDRKLFSNLWDDRCRVHLKKLEGYEFGKYKDEHVTQPRAALDRLLPRLRQWDEAGRPKRVKALPGPGA
jgi:hypothetical protein